MANVTASPIIASARARTDLPIVYQLHPREDEPHAINLDNGTAPDIFVYTPFRTMGRIFSRQQRWWLVFISERRETRVFSDALSLPACQVYKIIFYSLIYIAARYTIFAANQFTVRSGRVLPRHAI